MSPLAFFEQLADTIEAELVVDRWIDGWQPAVTCCGRQSGQRCSPKEVVKEPSVDSRIDSTLWALCVSAQSLRAFMSSNMRWRSGLIVTVLIGNSCLG